MGPKKDPGKTAGAGDVEEGGGMDTAVFLSNYQKYSKLIGLNNHTGVVKNLNDEEKYPVEQLIIDDEYGVLGPGGTRALMTSLMGSGVGMKGGPYKCLKNIRIWRSNINDDGAAAIAEVLRLGGADVPLLYLELIDDNIGPLGAMALGKSLSRGNNLSLLTIKLDYNSTLGTQGLINLCTGIRSNVTLKQLHACYCKISSEAGECLASVLGNPNSGLEVLNLGGNKLGGVGLEAICSGLQMNTKLEKLCLSDNYIDDMEEDLQGLNALKKCMINETSALISIDLLYNRIGEKGAKIFENDLVEGMNTKIEEFFVDSSIPINIFEKIFRAGGGKKKKGKKK